ncbi:ribbon-helix-helix domain-containing protein [Sphingobium yanoikuyae]|uniref:ribbon-helix-helix domain-containing protein n=1 Tax=Sphingobium yanoikuyae TaxID=13690 RepID=UPI003B90A189
MSRKGSLLALRDRDPAPTPASAEPIGGSTGSGTGNSPVAPSRQGKKAMTGYFSPEMSFAMHMTARKHGMSLQDAMAEAFNDWLRKMGESPVGK